MPARRPLCRPTLRHAGPALLAALLLPPLAAADPAGGGSDRRGEVTVTVLGARVQPVQPNGRPWDASHRSIPSFLYGPLAGLAGFPPLALLALVPYRNRPDPYVVVRTGEETLARSEAVPGSFAPPWFLAVPLPPPDRRAPTIAFDVLDDDVEEDDAIGTALAETASLLVRPGHRLLAGTRGLFDVSVVVRDPSAPGAGPETRLRIDSLRVQVRETRPLGGDWDPGGNPVARRFPWLPLPSAARGLAVSRPDLSVTLRWSAGGERTSPDGRDDFGLAWEGIGWDVAGHPGVGDGLYVEVVDRDLVLGDPVGILHVSLEDLAAAAREGTLVRAGDEWHGVAEVRLGVTAR
jgi:hypothetical protein